MRKLPFVCFFAGNHSHNVWSSAINVLFDAPSIIWYNLFHFDFLYSQYGWPGTTWRIRAGFRGWFLEPVSPTAKRNRSPMRRNKGAPKPDLTREFIRVNCPRPLTSNAKLIMGMVEGIICD